MKASPAKSPVSLLVLLVFTAGGFVVCTLLTRSPIEPLVGLLIFWGTLVIPPLVNRAWQWFRARQNV